MGDFVPGGCEFGEGMISPFSRVRRLPGHVAGVAAGFRLGASAVPTGQADILYQTLYVRQVQGKVRNRKAEWQKLEE